MIKKIVYIIGQKFPSGLSEVGALSCRFGVRNLQVLFTVLNGKSKILCMTESMPRKSLSPRIYKKKKIIVLLNLNNSEFVRYKNVTLIRRHA